MSCTGREVDRVAVTAIGDRDSQLTSAMTDVDLGAAGQPGMGGADAPVLVGLAAIGDAAVKIRVVNSASYVPWIC